MVCNIVIGGLVYENGFTSESKSKPEPPSPNPSMRRAHLTYEYLNTLRRGHVGVRDLSIYSIVLYYLPRVSGESSVVKNFFSMLFVQVFCLQGLISID